MNAGPAWLTDVLERLVGITEKAVKAIWLATDVQRAKDRLIAGIKRDLLGQTRYWRLTSTWHGPGMSKPGRW